MRVIAGTARRVSLLTPKGMGTRPTTDRIKETLFNMLQPYIIDSKFLDLFSGSGAIGIEALSRGASEAVFVEEDKEAIACIDKNLRATHLDSHGSVLSMDCQKALVQLHSHNKSFDIIFMDPPYRQGYEKKMIEYIASSSILNKDGILIFEASLDTEIDYVESFSFDIDRVKKYKTNMHVFLRYRKV